MKQAVEEWKRFIKENGKCILLSVVLACVCFGFQAFNGNIRIDTEEFINAPGSTLGWLYIGRYGLVLLKRLLGLTVHRCAYARIFCFGKYSSDLWVLSFFRRRQQVSLLAFFTALCNIKYLELSILFFASAGRNCISNAAFDCIGSGYVSYLL